jgi:origin recognition complex subunit 1
LLAVLKSATGMTRINFKPYSSEHLLEIVQSRLKESLYGLPERDKAKFEALECNGVIIKDAIIIAARKIAQISGDARRVLDVVR